MLTALRSNVKARPELRDSRGPEAAGETLAAFSFN